MNTEHAYTEREGLDWNGCTNRTVMLMHCCCCCSSVTSGTRGGQAEVVFTRAKRERERERVEECSGSEALAHFGNTLTATDALITHWNSQRAHTPS